MRARALFCLGLALGCTGRDNRWTETVDLLASSAPPEIVLENSQARISCPIAQALQFAENPVPLIPQQREMWRTRREKWASVWRDRAAALQRWSSAGVVRASRPDEIKDFLHAGLCGVVDRRTNEPQKEILIVVSHDPEPGSGGESREFRFVDGTPFLTAVDWMQ